MGALDMIVGCLWLDLSLISVKEEAITSIPAI